MAEYVIEDGVPVPQTRFGRLAKYPFAEMKVGQSFVAANGKQACSAAFHYATHRGVRFTSRKEGNDGARRIWRIA
ncbi:MAG: hypothetical protein KGL39_40875 [Patescibacteria group bacterium]|nr:hypothetical protein [Patescibacteria group bacterium]